MVPVDYTTENVAKCWCGQCPVQAQSACATRAYEEVKSRIERGSMPERGELPGLYCSTGRATCDDIRPTQRCLCPECLVWGEYGLRSNHYCVQGSAEDLGR